MPPTPRRTRAAIAIPVSPMLLARARNSSPIACAASSSARVSAMMPKRIQRAGQQFGTVRACGKRRRRAGTSMPASGVDWSRSSPSESAQARSAVLLPGDNDQGRPAVASDLQPSLEIGSGLGDRGAFRRAAAGNPVIGSSLGKQACLSAVIPKQARLGHAERYVALRRGDDPGMNFGPPPAQQAVVNGFLHQSMLERIDGIRRLAAT